MSAVESCSNGRAPKPNLLRRVKKSYLHFGEKFKILLVSPVQLTATSWPPETPTTEDGDNEMAFTVSFVLNEVNARIKFTYCLEIYIIYTLTSPEPPEKATLV